MFIGKIISTICGVKFIMYEIIAFSNVLSQVIPCITMLLHSLERTGGQEEVGVIALKKDLYDKALEKLGDFELERFYVVSTFLDPRYCIFCLIYKMSLADKGIISTG